MGSPVKYQMGSFPPGDIDWESLVSLIGSANAALARYDGLLSAMPNAFVLLSPLMTQEAVLSSRIEGTQATMGEVLEYEADDKAGELPVEKRSDIEEILNYRQAMNHAESMLKELPICQRVVKAAHKVLMQGVRGNDKTPGEYRRVSNWIGPPGCSIEDARYIPISADRLPEGMSSWEKYVHSETRDRLVQLAVLHAEFEALHPFLDGNGRLGRMLIPLFMHNTGLISSPAFYVSAFFERNRDEYYDSLLKISSDNDWTQWIVFFLEAIVYQAEDNQKKANSILGLYEKNKVEFVSLLHSQYSIQALDFMFRQPIFKSTHFVSNAGMPATTARRLLSELRTGGALKTLYSARGSRSAVYVFAELLNIAEGKDIF